MEFLFHEDKIISGQDLKDLFVTLNWESARYGPRLDLIPKSTISLGAWEADKLIGYINAFSDGLNAYIQYFCVAPEYQGKGIGKSLMSRMKEKLSGHERISLTAVTEAADFYFKAGFFVREGKISLALKDI